MYSQPLPDGFIGHPYTGKGCGLCGHHINTHPVFHGKISNSISYHFKNLILTETTVKDCSYQSKGYIHRPHTRYRSSTQFHSYDRRTSYVISASQSLPGNLCPPFSDSHGTKAAITGMAVTSKDHSASPCRTFPHILMNNSCIWRHKNTTQLFHAP